MFHFIYLFFIEEEEKGARDGLYAAIATSVGVFRVLQARRFIRKYDDSVYIDYQLFIQMQWLCELVCNNECLGIHVEKAARCSGTRGTRTSRGGGV